MEAREIRKSHEQESVRPSGRVYIYGRNAVRECLLAGRRKVYRLLVAYSHSASQTLEAIESLAARSGLQIERVERSILDRLTHGANHQGVVIEASEFSYSSIEDLLASGELRGKDILMLDSLQDPQNFGTLLRTAEVFGIGAVIIPEHRSVEVTPAVVNASSGATEHLNISKVTNLARTASKLKEYGYWVLGLEYDESSSVIWDVDLRIPICLVVGSEGSGIRELVRKRCDLLVKIPQAGRIGSLNAAVAGSIALYEIYKSKSSK